MTSVVEADSIEIAVDKHMKEMNELGIIYMKMILWTIMGKN